MGSEGQSLLTGETESWLDNSAFAVAAAGELISPLVLLRQLGLVMSDADMDDQERMVVAKQLTLTSERALRMATSLSMSSGAQQQLSLEPINPLSVCQEVIHELAPLFAAHGHKIDMKSRVRVPLLVANRRALQQILLSFGDNALHYGSENHPIRISISGHGSYVRIGVRDYGPAVPIDVWQRLDSRVARRAPAPIATRPTSSAVSLVAARRLAEMMGSAVGLIRHRDGATFYVDLKISGQMSLL